MRLFGSKPEPEPKTELVAAAEVGVRLRVDVEGAAHRAAIMERFERAAEARTLALDLNTRAELAMVEAVNAYDEARKALRRVAEGGI